MSFFKRILTMAFLGAFGAAAGALAGEFLFSNNEVNPQTQPKSICLLFDVSGSMDDTTPQGITQLQALKQAAGGFVKRQDFETDEMGLVSFASGAKVLTPPVRNVDKLSNSIRRLEAGGMTNLAQGLQLAQNSLKNTNGERWILLFSDGKPKTQRQGVDPEMLALEAAEKVRNAGIQIVAITTSLADRTTLERVAGNPDNVFLSEFTALDEAFKSSEELIQTHQMLTTEADNTSFVDSVKKTGIWASLIAIGTGLLLVGAQNRYLHRRFLGLKDILVVAFGGILTGAAAGAGAQTLFNYISALEADGAAGRVASWVLLGLGAGIGLSFFVPNLGGVRAALGGIVGGAAAGAFFVYAIPQLGEYIPQLDGDRPGRIAAAAILGLCTGMMIVVVEAVSRKAWLVVHWGKGEESEVSLGAQPLVIGNSASAHIPLTWNPDAPAVLARVSYVAGEIKIEDPNSNRTKVLTNGMKLSFGKVVIEARESAVDGKAQPPQKSTAPPPKPQLKKREPAKSR
jgi:Ca-activated chloride channel family protein